MKKDDNHDTSDLEKKLEEIQNEKQAKEVDGEQGTLNNESFQKIDALENELKEQKEITKRAQYDYLNLKMDFDRHQKMLEEKSAGMEVDILISTVKKFLPFVENLRKSLASFPEDKKQEPLVKGLQIMYDNFLKTLAGLSIKPIAVLGLVPDSFLHEPVNVQPVEDPAMKGKIIQEFEQGFLYEKNGDKRVIIPSKVVIGS